MSKSRDDSGPFDNLPRRNRKPREALPFVPGEVVANRYKIELVLGWGSFGRVYRANRLADNVRVALKVSDKAVSLTESEPQMAAEFRKLQSLSHRNIPKVFEAFLEPSTNRYCIAMQFASGIQLRELITRGIHPLQSAQAIADIADALDYLHGEGFFHRDLKPENLLLRVDGHAWLLDFGSSSRDDVLWHQDDLGNSTKDYLPLSLQFADSRNLDWTTEVASLGLILRELLTGVALYTKSREARFVNLAIVARHPFPDSVPAKLKEICVRSLQTRQVDSYITAREFADDLRSWIATVNGDEPAARRLSDGAKSVCAWRAGRYVAEAIGPSKDVSAALVAISECEIETASPELSIRLVMVGVRFRECVAYAARYLAQFGATMSIDEIESSYQRIVYNHGRLSDELLAQSQSETDAMNYVLAQAPEFLAQAGESCLLAYKARYTAERAAEGSEDSDMVEKLLGCVVGTNVDHGEFVEAIRTGNDVATLRRLLYVLDRKVERALKNMAD